MEQYHFPLHQMFVLHSDGTGGLIPFWGFDSPGNLHHVHLVFKQASPKSTQYGRIPELVKIISVFLVLGMITLYLAHFL